MERAVDLPGSAHPVLAEGVLHLDPASAVFEAMLEGWKTQQRARFLKAEGTIKPRLDLVRRFGEYTNQYPWQWSRPMSRRSSCRCRSRRQRRVTTRTACGCSASSSPTRGTAGRRSVWSCSAWCRGRSCTRRTRSATSLCQSCAPQSRDTCCRCDRIRVVAARWPIGPVCRACYLTVLNSPSECARCRVSRPLIGLDTDGMPICGPCVGIDHAYTCTRCGHSGNPHGAGLCARCVLDDRLRNLLAGPDGTVSPQLQPVHQALAAGKRPRSLIYWLAHSPNVTLLAQLAATG
jgi:hypothetical protein